MAGKRKPKGKSKGKPIKSVDELTPGEGRLLTPRDQLAQYYGGRAGVDDAVADADALASEVYPAMGDIDPEMMNMFPPPNYEQYGRPSTVAPVMVDDPGADLAMPVGYMDQDPTMDMPVPLGMNFDTRAGNIVNLNPTARDFQLVDTSPDGDEAMSRMIEQPMTTNITDPEGVMYPGNSIRGTPLIPQDEASSLAQMLLDPDGFGKGEIMSQLTPEMQALAGDISNRSRPFAIDQALAQLRRTNQPTGSTADFANLLLDRQIDSARGLTSGAYPGQTVDRSGLTTADLIALSSLPKRVRNFLPTRMGMIPSVMGATAAGATAYGMSKDPNMINKNTMGGPSY